jgi:hypothetical protein
MFQKVAILAPNADVASHLSDSHQLFFVTYNFLFFKKKRKEEVT